MRYRFRRVANYDQMSPSNGVIADNSMLTMIQNSLTDGILYCLEDLEDQLDVLKAFWSAVRDTFGEPAWGELPRKSRLMHGAGIASMGFLMDTIGDRHMRRRELTKKLFARELQTVAPFCNWTEGTWEFGPEKSLKWNEIQNVPGHIQLLSNHLLQLYLAKK